MIQDVVILLLSAKKELPVLNASITGIAFEIAFVLITCAKYAM